LQILSFSLALCRKQHQRFKRLSLKPLTVSTSSLSRRRLPFRHDEPLETWDAAKAARHISLLQIHSVSNAFSREICQANKLRVVAMLFNKPNLIPA
jgi:hypothetical protein